MLLQLQALLGMRKGYLLSLNESKYTQSSSGIPECVAAAVAEGVQLSPEHSHLPTKDAATHTQQMRSKFESTRPEQPQRLCQACSLLGITVEQCAHCTLMIEMDFICKRQIDQNHSFAVIFSIAVD